MTTSPAHWGVWASPDTEVAITPKYALAYLRRPDCLLACAYVRDARAYHLRGLSASSWGRTWGSLTHAGGTCVFRGDRHLAELADSAVPSEFQPDSNPFFDADRLELVEAIVTGDQRPAPVASRDTVGQNIILWNVGSQSLTDPDSLECFAIVLNTTRHWCIFEHWPSAATTSIYCRCARVAASNAGMMFVQNVKMSINDAERLNQCYMAPDNLAAARADLVVDQSRFDPEKCALIGAEGREWATIYWSLKSVTGNRIVLHGCEGREYVYDRPPATLDKGRETFLTA